MRECFIRIFAAHLMALVEGSFGDIDWQDPRWRRHTDLCLVSGGSFDRIKLVLCYNVTCNGLFYVLCVNLTHATSYWPMPG